MMMVTTNDKEPRWQSDQKAIITITTTTITTTVAFLSFLFRLQSFQFTRQITQSLLQY